MKTKSMSQIMLVLLVGAFSNRAQAAFSENSRRYLSSKDMFSVMMQKFPVLKDSSKAKSLSPYCWIANNQNLSVLGSVIPVTGKPASDLPSPGFVRWLGSCAAEIIRLQVEDLKAQPTKQSLWANYFPKAILTDNGEHGKAQTNLTRVLTMKWGDLTSEVQDEVILHAIEELIGPDSVVRELGFAKNSSELSKIVRRTLSGDEKAQLEQSIIQIYSALVMREEFLTY